MTVSCEPGMESDVSAFVHALAPGARVTYAVAHTFKFEIPTNEVSTHVPSALQLSALRSCAQSHALSLFLRQTCCCLSVCMYVVYIRMS